MSKEMRTLHEINFVETTDKWRAVWRADYKGCRLELTGDKKHLTVTDENTSNSDYFSVGPTESFDFPNGSVNFINCDDQGNAACDNWTDAEWAEVEKAVRRICSCTTDSAWDEDI